MQRHGRDCHRTTHGTPIGADSVTVWQPEKYFLECLCFAAKPGRPKKDLLQKQVPINPKTFNHENSRPVTRNGRELFYCGLI
jgi:hypothetical protein